MKKLILLTCIIAASASIAEARRKARPPNPDSFKEEAYLKEQIQETGLDNTLPTELQEACEGKDKTKVWTQLMIGLSYIESKWNDHDNNPHDAGGRPSTGKFQMTHGDTALGKPCFKSQAETRNAEKNISCAVRKMKELMNKNPSLRKSASRYWGPFGSKQYARKGKGGSVVAMVAATCGGPNKKGSFDDYNFGGDDGSLATNNQDYWEQVENYSPYTPRSERQYAKKSRRSRQASR